MAARRPSRGRGFVVSVGLVFVFAILGVAVIVGLGLLRNALFARASSETIVDSDTPPNVLGRPVDFGLCEEPRLLCPDPGRGTTPDPARGLWALVAVRPDRFVTRNAVYYTASDCVDSAAADDVYVAPPAVPAPLGALPPVLPVGYLDAVETAGAMSPLSYGVGAPAGFVFATMSPTGPGLLYRSADEPVASVEILSVWTSLAPDCPLEPLPDAAQTPAEALCTNIAATTLELIRAEEVVADPGMAGSPNLLAGFVPPFRIDPASAAPIAPSPEGVPALPPSGMLVAPEPES